MKLIRKVGILFLVFDLIFINYFSVVRADDTEVAETAGTAETQLAEPPTEPTAAVYDASGHKVTTEQANAVLEFLNDLEPTTDYVVYSDTFIAGTDHVEGNVCVNELEAGTPSWSDQPTSDFLIKTENLDSKESKVSYIGDAKDIKIWANEKDDIIITTDPDDVKFENRGQVQAVDELGVNIQENLDNIVEAAETMTEVCTDLESGSDAVKAAAKLLEDKTVKKNDIIILNLSASDFEKPRDSYISDLIKANKNTGATVVVNIDTSATESSITIYQGVEQYQSDETNNYLVWNFGSYDGTISFECVGVFAGVIVAPNATVITKGIYEGRVVADTYQNTGSEIHQPRKHDKIYPKPTEEEEEEEQPPEEEDEDTSPEEEDEDEELPPPPEEDNEDEEVPPPPDDDDEDEPETPPPAEDDDTDVTPPPPEDDTPELPPDTPTLYTVTPPEEEPIIIPDEPVPGAPVGRDVLGAREDDGRRAGGVIQGVLGVKAGPPQDVLGERRGPITGDKGLDLVVLLSLELLCLSIIYIIYKNREKNMKLREERKLVFM